MVNIKLNDGNTIPQVGLGTCRLEKEECYEKVLYALKIGYRHIDTAEIYFNHKEIGRAIKDSGINREEIFITTKVWPNNYKKEKIRKSVGKSLEQLSTDYIDLVLLHKSIGKYTEAWKELEELQKEGKIKSIGVSSFNGKQLEKIINLNGIKPVVDQIEVNPFTQRQDYVEYLEKKDIKAEVWYPLGHGNKKIINHPLFVELSNKYNKTPVQIILRWHVQRNHIVFPKSTNPKHLKENLEIFDFELSEEDMNRISKIDKKRSFDTIPIFLQYPIIFFLGLDMYFKKY